MDKETLLREYRAWAEERTALCAEEETNFPAGPADKEAWPDSDDQAAELLHAFAALVEAL